MSASSKQAKPSAASARLSRVPDKGHGKRRVTRPGNGVAAKSSAKAGGSGKGGPREQTKPRPKVRPPLEDGVLSNMVIDHALDVAERIRAQAVFLSGDLIPEMRVLDSSKRKFDIYIVTHDIGRLILPDAEACKVLKVPNIPVGRIGKIKVAMVMAASRGLLHVGDRLVCVSGLPEAGMLDTIVVMQVGTETEVMTTSDIGGFAERVKAGVFDTVLELALELANEGREGKPVGTIFVIASPKGLKGHMRQLVLNPFKGYSEKERQILDPAVRGTIKEFSTIDGAFVIDPKGVVHSAGTYLEALAMPTELPPGLGARHHAAAAITAAVPGAIAIAVSESTGEVRVFRHGVAVADIEPGTYRPPSADSESGSN